MTNTYYKNIITENFAMGDAMILAKIQFISFRKTGVTMYWHNYFTQQANAAVSEMLCEFYGV